MSEHLRKHWAGLAFVLIAALPFFAILGTEEERLPPAPEDAVLLTIVSPHRREVKQEYSRGFRQWMQEKHGRAVDIRWLDVGGTSTILKDLESRFTTTPDNPGIDLFFGGGVDPYLKAKEKGWLEPCPVPEALLKDIPAQCAGFPVYDPEGYWYGVAHSGFGILYNKRLVKQLGLPAPTSWDALAQPGWYGWVGSGDPRKSGSVHACYEIILQAYGWEQGWRLITLLAANVRSFGDSGGTVPTEVAAGEIAAGPVIDQYARTAIERIGGEHLAFALPRGLTVINPDAIGVIRNPSDRELARLFVQFALSAEGQRLLYRPAGVAGQRYSLYRAPVRAELYKEKYAPATNPYDFEPAFTYDSALGSRRWRYVNDLMGAWLLDTHGDLTAAWKAILDGGMQPHLVQMLTQPPVTEAEMTQHLEFWNDPQAARERSDILSFWAERAGARYRSARRQAGLNW